MDGPTPLRQPASQHPPKAKPDPRPMRLVLGASGLAAFSALVAGIVLPPRPAALAFDQTAQGVTNPGSAGAVQVQRPVKYIQLAPGQTAPPGAKVIDGTAPQPGTVVTTVQAPAPKPIIIKTTQSGRVVK